MRLVYFQLPCGQQFLAVEIVPIGSEVTITDDVYGKRHSYVVSKIETGLTLRQNFTYQVVRIILEEKESLPVTHEFAHIVIGERVMTEYKT